MFKRFSGCFQFLIVISLFIKSICELFVSLYLYKKYHMITAKVLVYKNNKDLSKPCPFKLRITERSISKYFPIIIHSKFNNQPIVGMIPAEFDRIKSAKRRGIDEKNFFEEITEIENKAVGIIKKMPVFSFEKFEAIMFKEKGFGKSVSELYKIVIEELYADDRIGTAMSYNCSLVSLMKFNNGKDFKFSDITTTFLKRYENQITRIEGKSITTVGIYLRALKAVYNRAISEGIIDKSVYPFGEKKYNIPTGKNIKKALKPSDIALIWNYRSTDVNKIKARDFWIFSYLCNGMNIKDIIPIAS
jgi:integrase/recombinase XerD